MGRIKTLLYAGAGWIAVRLVRSRMRRRLGR